MGFTLIKEDAEGNRMWEFKIEDDYENRNHYIDVNR